jgi:hypothetical protein
MSKEQPDYLSYLLRLWREIEEDEISGRDKNAVWHASLESSLTGKRRGFCSLDDLFVFLLQETGGLVDGDVTECDTGQ